MRCNRCGKPIEDSMQYCPHCGSEIIRDSTPREAKGKRLDLLKEYDKAFLNQPEKKPKKAKKTIIYWLLGILLALFALALICYALGLSLPGAETISQNPSVVTVTQNDFVNTSDSSEFYLVTVGDGNRLSLRSEPNENATKLDRIDNGTRLLITEVHNGWGKTTYNNQAGWVCIQNEDGTYCIKE